MNILLCDDHTMIRQSLALLLEQQPGWRVVGQAGNGAEAIALSRSLKPDLVVLDVAMPEVNGIDAAAAIRAAAPATRIIALSMYGDSHYRERMRESGAMAYVLKNEAAAELVAAIETVLLGGTYLSFALRDEQPPEPRRCAELERDKLSSREIEVLRLLARGSRNRAIAEQLGISVKTVETYRARLMIKLDAKHLVDLVKFAIRAGIVSSD